MLLGGYIGFAVLFGASGVVRFTAAQQTERSAASHAKLETAGA